MYFGYPATKSSGYFNKVPNFTGFTAPGFGKWGKPCGPWGKGPWGWGFGAPYSKSSGFSNVVPNTTVATSPVPF